MQNPKIARWVRDHTANGRQAEFLVVLSDQADLTQAKALKSRHERRHRVREALWNKAQQTQQPILQWLRERKIEHRSFYIVNAIWVKADADVAAALAARPDVLRVEGNPLIRNNIIESVVTIDTPEAPTASPTPEPGIVYSYAPQVWSLGYTGQGIVVAGADTGYRWTHQALKNQYRGWDGTAANHDYNWHDSIHSTNGSNPCGHDATAPCDDDAHGTHTMGTAVGSDGGNNLIGMAPGARWIGCRNMESGNGTPARYMECMEFFLAPYPVGGTSAQGNPDRAPDISTNSWSCPTSEGCSPNTLLAAIEAQRAAGIFMVVAAGNSGPTCGSVTDPPGIYDDVYTAGALSTGSDIAASFSSRGPVGVDGSLRVKPDLAAPGTNTRSSVNTSNSAYAKLSGTSMATPHIAGAVALLWCAVPSLKNDVAATEQILNESAVPLSSTDGCGATGIPNDTYGNGRLDVKAAVDYALLETTPLTITRNVDGTATFQFHGGAGRTYRLERRFAFDDANDWQPAPGVNDLVATTDGPAYFTDPYAFLYDGEFYRVRVLQ
jgi:subtilisin family serine protease